MPCGPWVLHLKLEPKVLPFEQEPVIPEKETPTIAWPIRSDFELGRWRLNAKTCRALWEKGFLRLGRFDPKRMTWSVGYLRQKAIKEIENGTLSVLDYDDVTGVANLSLSEDGRQLTPIKTVWNRKLHFAGAHGSSMLRNIIGESSTFSFPKSVYSTKDAIAAVTADNPTAIIVDFLAGSGTTLNSVNLLNSVDGGSRRCI
jgi:adenine-specific DNA-methyltransferase